MYYYGYRYYSPLLGRWLSRDPLGEQEGPNLKGFLRNEPNSRVDYLGLEIVFPGQNPYTGIVEYPPDAPGPILGENQGPRRQGGRNENGRRFLNLSLFDERGRDILDHWLNGSGEPVEHTGGVWGDYMMANEGLRNQLMWRLIEEDAMDRIASGAVDLTFPIIMRDNGYGTGYQMLHGTNAWVGDFQIRGQASVYDDLTGNGRFIWYNELEYTWNDIIDPEVDTYLLDFIFAWGAEMLYDPSDYRIQLNWKATSCIRIVGADIIETAGYPFQ